MIHQNKSSHQLTWICKYAIVAALIAATLCEIGLYVNISSWKDIDYNHNNSFTQIRAILKISTAPTNKLTTTDNQAEYKSVSNTLNNNYNYNCSECCEWDLQCIVFGPRDQTKMPYIAMILCQYLLHMDHITKLDIKCQ